MSTNDQQLDENAHATLDETRDEEDTTDNLDDLFADADENDDEEAPVSREEYNRLLKGTQKLATELGRIKSEKKSVPVVKTEVNAPANAPVSQNDDVLELFYGQTPNAKLVEAQLKDVADKLYGGSILKAWKGEEFLREKAEKLSADISEREANKDKLTPPMRGKTGAVNYKSLSANEAMKLSDDEYIKWSEANQ